MLAEDGVSCRDYDGYLLYSERTILKSIHLSDETNLNAPIKPFEDAEHMKNVIALAFDYQGGVQGASRIFYSDIHFGNIQQINDDGTGRKTIVESEDAHPLCSLTSGAWGGQVLETVGVFLVLASSLNGTFLVPMAHARRAIV